ncbi:hypothetical protein JCM14036_12480 [Desulfotomaculum defluvii]
MEDDQILQLLATRIREKRLELGLTQEELANRLDKSKADISNLENAKMANPTIRSISAVARALGLELWELLKPENDDIHDYPEALEDLLSAFREKNIKIREEEIKVLEKVRIKGKIPEVKEVYLLFWLLQRGLSKTEIERIYDI